jgi:quinone-modifying oxidoreductase subunit QmoC
VGCTDGTRPLQTYVFEEGRRFVRTGSSSSLLEYTPRLGVGTTDGEALRDCIQCGTCSAVCPLADYMEHSPRRLIALLRAGQDDDVLRSRAIWVCTSCYACMVECPKQLPVTDAIYALKREAMRTSVYPRRFPTPVMARQFVAAVDKWGRSTESWISVSLYLRTDPLQLLRHVRLALRLLRTGRLSFRRESIREPAQLRRMLDALDTAAGPEDGL